MTDNPLRYSLSDLYDADKRATDRRAAELAARLPIPHPLRNVQYADGISPCSHAKRHARFEFCPPPLPDDPQTSPAPRLPRSDQRDWDEIMADKRREWLRNKDRRALEVSAVTEALVAHTRLTIDGQCSCGHVVPLGRSVAEHQAEAVLNALRATLGHPPGPRAKYPEVSVNELTRALRGIKDLLAYHEAHGDEPVEAQGPSGWVNIADLIPKGI